MLAGPRMLQPMIQASHAQVNLHCIWRASLREAVRIYVNMQVNYRFERQSTKPLYVFENEALLDPCFLSMQDLFGESAGHGNAQQALGTAPRKRWKRKQKPQHAHVHEWITHLVGRLRGPGVKSFKRPLPKRTLQG